MTQALLAVLLLATAAPLPPEDAETLLAAGVAQFEAGEFALAQAKLQRAVALAELPAARARGHLYRGLALASLEKAAAAEAEFVAALRDDPLVEVDATRVKERLAKLFREARDKLTGVLEIGADHEALVRVDGASAGSAPVLQSVRVGRHTVDAASADGAWRSAPTEAVVPVDGKVVLALRLSQVLGTLRLTSAPSGAQVSVDGVRSADTPIELQLPVGNHALRAALPTGEAWQEAVPITEGAVTVRHAVLASSPLEGALAPPPPVLAIKSEPRTATASPLRPAGIALTALGGAGLVGAGVFAILGEQENRAIRGGGFERPEDIQAAANRGNSYNIAGYACLAGGAAVLGTGIVLLALGHRTQPGITLLPVASPGGAGVALSGAWP